MRAVAGRFICSGEPLLCMLEAELLSTSSTIITASYGPGPDLAGRRQLATCIKQPAPSV